MENISPNKITQISIENSERKEELKKKFIEIVARAIGKYPQAGMGTFEIFEVLQNILLEIKNKEDTNFIFTESNYTVKDYQYFQEISLRVYKAYEQRGLKVPNIVKTEITEENFLFHILPSLLNYFINTTEKKFHQFTNLKNDASLKEIGETIKKVFKINGLNKKIKEHIEFIIQIQNEKEEGDPIIKIEISQKAKEVAKFVFEELNERLIDTEGEIVSNENMELTKKIYEIIISELESKFEFE